jgi:hypothetical protein
MIKALNNVKCQYKIMDKHTLKSGVRPPNTTIRSWTAERVEHVRHTALCLQRDAGTSCLSVTAICLSATVTLVPMSCDDTEKIRGHTFTALHGEYRPPYTITLVVSSGPRRDRRVQVWCSISKFMSDSSETFSTLRVLLPVVESSARWSLLEWKNQ